MKTKVNRNGKEIPNDIDTYKFLSKIAIDETSGCWEWTGAIGTGGYGNFSFKGKNYRSHRVSYFIHKGAIPEGLVIDHICRNKSCSNPEHLRAVDSKTNSLENSMGVCALNKKKTHCKNGHELTEDNIYKKKHWRCCLACKKIDHVRHNQKLKEKRRIAKLAKEALGE